MYRVSSDCIDSLNQFEVFVFGSNLSGRHGLGAAKTAMKWGAVYGQAEGFAGQTYAIPTVNATITDKLCVEEIKVYVDRFINFAKQYHHQRFLVTEIGCGLAGWDVADIAPLFKEAIAVQNIYLPKRFWEYYREHNIVA